MVKFPGRYTENRTYDAATRDQAKTSHWRCPHNVPIWNHLHHSKLAWLAGKSPCSIGNTSTQMVDLNYWRNFRGLTNIKAAKSEKTNHTQRRYTRWIHVWYIYQYIYHSKINQMRGQYTSLMDPMGPEANLNTWQHRPQVFGFVASTRQDELAELGAHRVGRKSPKLALGIQSPCQMMIGVYNHLLSKAITILRRWLDS